MKKTLKLESLQVTSFETAESNPEEWATLRTDEAACWSPLCGPTTGPAICPDGPAAN